MFTGIIEEIGEVYSVSKRNKSAILSIRGNKIFSDLKLGDSVAVNGICLTVDHISNNSFTSDVMNETLRRTTLNTVSCGCHVNLERALSVNGRFGGHIVSGHVDGIGRVSFIHKEGNFIWYTIKASDEIMKYIIEKGSIAIDGISLTVAKTEKNSFSVSVIPHTLNATILSEKAIGSKVNLENDVFGKYIEHFLDSKSDSNRNSNSITMEYLNNAGFY